MERGGTDRLFRKTLHQGLFLIYLEPFMLRKAWEILHIFPSMGIEQILGPPAPVEVMLGR